MKKLLQYNTWRFLSLIFLLFAAESIWMAEEVELKFYWNSWFLGKWLETMDWETSIAGLLMLLGLMDDGILRCSSWKFLLRKFQEESGSFCEENLRIVMRFTKTIRKLLQQTSFGYLRSFSEILGSFLKDSLKSPLWIYIR